jgi:F-type H+-transporting ATPase subunit b
VNWFYGFLGEKEGVEPSLLYRKPGTPVPVGVLLVDTALLFFIIGRIAGPSVGQGLRDRKQRIAGDIEAASAMKAEAEGQLSFYENKLEQMSAEMERIKVDMRTQATLEREHILKEAAARREAMEREARHLVEQELAATKQTIAHLVAHEAIRLAREEIQKSLTPADNERLAKEFLGDLEKRSKSEVVS